MDISKLNFDRRQHLEVGGVTSSIDEFHIRQTTYEISIKLELDIASLLSFDTVYSRNKGADKNPVPLYCVRQSSDLLPDKDETSDLKDVLPYFAFYLELDRGIKTQNLETCTLFLKSTAACAVVKDDLPLFKYAVRVICPCNSKDKKMLDENVEFDTGDFYPECNKFAMNDFNQHTCLQLSKHSHDWQKYGLAQEYFITVTEFDFSEATMIPYEAQRILAKRTLQKEVKDTHGAYFTEIKRPFDVTIICIDGMEIDVHSFVLSTRNHVFRKMLSTKKVSGRGSSFRKLAKEAFLGISDRNKKTKTKTIDEPELTSVTMKVLLHFIYFGELHTDWKINLANILRGAQKYGLQQFLEMLNCLLITVCKKNNALRLLKLAERYSLKGAESAIQDYVFANLGGVLQSSVQITSV